MGNGQKKDARRTPGALILPQREVHRTPAANHDVCVVEDRLSCHTIVVLKASALRKIVLLVSVFVMVTGSIVIETALIVMQRLTSSSNWWRCCE